MQKAGFLTMRLIYSASGFIAYLVFVQAKNCLWILRLSLWVSSIYYSKLMDALSINQGIVNSVKGNKSTSAVEIRCVFDDI